MATSADSLLAACTGHAYHSLSTEHSIEHSTCQERARDMRQAGLLTHIEAIEDAVLPLLAGLSKAKRWLLCQRKHFVMLSEELLQQESPHLLLLRDITELIACIPLIAWTSELPCASIRVRDRHQLCWAHCWLCTDLVGGITDNHNLPNLWHGRQRLQAVHGNGLAQQHYVLLGDGCLRQLSSGQPHGAGMQAEQLQSREPGAPPCACPPRRLTR